VWNFDRARDGRLGTHLANHGHASEVVEVLYSTLVAYKARSSETRPPPQTLIRSTKKLIIFSSVLGRAFSSSETFAFVPLPDFSSSPNSSTYSKLSIHHFSLSFATPSPCSASTTKQSFLIWRTSDRILKPLPCLLGYCPFKTSEFLFGLLVWFGDVAMRC